LDFLVWKYIIWQPWSDAFDTFSVLNIFTYF
jgi:hypothetical protein